MSTTAAYLAYLEKGMAAQKGSRFGRSDGEEEEPQKSDWTDDASHVASFNVEVEQKELQRKRKASADGEPAAKKQKA